MKQVNYTTSGSMSYSSEPRWNIDNLRFNTIYDIKVIPFRKYNQVRQLAIPYDTLTLKTDCSGKWSMWHGS